MGKGELKIEGNRITLQDGSGHIEKEIMLGSGKQMIYAKVNGNDLSFDLYEPGAYILNLKTDTIVGAHQKIGADLNNQKTITFEDLKVIIDSLNNLILGKNVSTQNRNYLIAPNQLQAISMNTMAKIYGPYKKVSATQELGADGKEPEIYKFYTNKEMRELIEAKAKMIPTNSN